MGANLFLRTSEHVGHLKGVPPERAWVVSKLELIGKSTHKNSVLEPFWRYEVFLLWQRRKRGAFLPKLSFLGLRDSWTISNSLFPKPGEDRENRD